MMTVREVTAMQSEGVLAAEDIHVNAQSVPIAVNFLNWALTEEKFDVFPTSKLHYLKVFGDELRVEGLSAGDWVSMIPLAEDVQEETILLALRGQTEVQATVIKEVQKGTHPKLWFSSELATLLGLPFLNFSHIRGKEYVCPHCDKKFRAPNKLKVHLSNKCKTSPLLTLKDRLNSFPRAVRPNSWSLPFLLPTLTPTFDAPKYPFLTINSFQRQPAKPIFHFPHTMSPGSLVDRKVPYTATPSKPECRKSAFRPFKESKEGILNLPAVSLPGISQDLTTQLSRRPDTSGEQKNICEPSNSYIAKSSPPPAPDHYAEVEALVSNLGRGRGGHICLYCGKIYSRKYGLKIHIRTHTGYKPLSCKVCHRAFGDPSNLNKHVRLHAEGATPYRCRYCGKVLVRRRDLARHLSSRHPDKPNIMEEPGERTGRI